MRVTYDSLQSCKGRASESQSMALTHSLQATLGDLLAEKAVILRINASSQEAGFLSAFCSLNEIPKLVVIKYGRNLAFNDIT